MFNPSIHADKENNYMLASIIGKRTVQLAKGSEILTDCDSSNKVTIAICENKANKLTYTSKKSVETGSSVINKKRMEIK